MNKPASTSWLSRLFRSDCDADVIDYVTATATAFLECLGPSWSEMTEREKRLYPDGLSEWEKDQLWNARPDLDRELMRAWLTLSIRKLIRDARDRHPGLVDADMLAQVGSDLLGHEHKHIGRGSEALGSDLGLAPTRPATHSKGHEHVHRCQK